MSWERSAASLERDGPVRTGLGGGQIEKDSPGEVEGRPWRAPQRVWKGRGLYGRTQLQLNERDCLVGRRERRLEGGQERSRGGGGAGFLLIT